MINWDETPDLNITPLVDIMLVLLAILMVTTPALIYEENILLPSGSKKKVVDKAPKLEIRVDANRVVHIKQDSMKLSELPDNIVLLANQYKNDIQVYIRADKMLRYEDVMFVLKSLKEAGFSKVSLETGG